MSCPCDVATMPTVPALAPGRTHLSRQVATAARFPDIRQRLLAAVRLHPVLATWRARDPADLGVMLLELAAYLGDVLGFYDEVRAHEAYLRTARLTSSVERLVHLIGYRPRPAVAANVRVALVVDGTSPRLLPAGTGFRSGAFAGEAPQVFESAAAETLHPAYNALTMVPRQPATLSGTLASLYLVAATARVAAGQLVLIECPGATPAAYVRTVTAVARVLGEDRQRYARITLDRPITLATPVAAAAVRLFRPTRTATATKLVRLDPPALAFHTVAPMVVLGGGSLQSTLAAVALANGTGVRLDAVHAELKTHDRVILSLGTEHRWFALRARGEGDQVLIAGYRLTIGEQTIDVPAVTQKVSILNLDARANAASKREGGSTWRPSDVADLVVQFGMVEVGQAVVPASAVLAATDPLVVSGGRTPWYGAPAPGPDRLLLRDADGRGVDLAAQVDLATGAVATTGAAWSPPLRHPVTAHANVVELTRGESVPHEVLGSGDAGRASQRFTLSKKPLTYLPSATTARGVVSTLTVWVDGVTWTEVETWFGHGPDAQVYVVRDAADGTTTVEFGDGIRGARLPTGRGNVTARYRFGAGAKAPPAGSITQLATPQPGVRQVVQVVAAGGGADREDAADLRRLAPASALLLGRAISIADLEACAAGVPGVTAAAAAWRWHGGRQTALAQIWYVGDAAIETVRSRVRQFADPSTPIDVAVASPVSVGLRIAIEVDPRRVIAEVVAAVREALLDPRLGFLSLAQLGIGAPLLRSRLLAAVLAVPGAVGVRGMFWKPTPSASPFALVGAAATASLVGNPFVGLGRSPGTGRYFDWAAPDALRLFGSHP